VRVVNEVLLYVRSRPCSRLSVIPESRRLQAASPAPARVSYIVTPVIWILIGSKLSCQSESPGASPPVCLTRQLAAASLILVYYVPLLPQTPLLLLSKLYQQI
jgi:hypothetical protein